MTKARITKCGDGHWRRVVYGLGPYIADYPEQCMLACVVSGWCPRFVSASSLYYPVTADQEFANRCIALASNLDGDQDDILVHRSHSHTEDVRQLCGDELKEMWDGYGIIGDVVVSAVELVRPEVPP